MSQPSLWQELKSLIRAMFKRKSIPQHLMRFLPAITIVLGTGLVAMIASKLNWTTKDEALLWLDMKTDFWVLLILFAGIISGFFFFAKDLLRHLKRHRPSLGYVLIVLACGVLSVIFAGGNMKDPDNGESRSRIVAMHRVQSDEAIFLNVAQNMAHRYTAATCEEALMDRGMECLPGAKNNIDTDHFKLKAQSFLLTLGMPFFGRDLHWIWGFQLVLLFGLNCLLGLALWLWLGEAFLSLVALALVVWTPLTLFQYRSFSVEPLYLTLGSLVFVIYHFVLKSESKNLLLRWAWLGALVGFWLHTRQETIFALPALFLFALPRLEKDSLAIAIPKQWPQWRQTFADPLVLWTSVLALAAFPAMALIINYSTYNFQGGEFEAHHHFWENLRMLWQQMTLPHQREAVDNLFSASWAQLTKEWFKVDESALLTTPFLSSHAWLALFGIPALIWSAWRESKVMKWTVFLALFHLQSYMILENVSGDLSIEINQRYAMIWLPVQALLAAMFLRVLLFQLLPKLFPKEHGHKILKDSVLLALVAVIGVIALTWRHERSFKENIMYSDNHLTNEEKIIHEWLAGQAKVNRLFVYNRSLHFVGDGISSVKYETWDQWPQSTRDELLNRFAGEVYYVRGLDCAQNQNNHGKATGQDASGLCESFESTYAMSKVFETKVLDTYPLVIAKLGGVANPDMKVLGFKPKAVWQMEMGVQANVCPVGSTFSLAINGKTPQVIPCHPGINVLPITGDSSAATIDVQLELHNGGPILSKHIITLNADPRLYPLALEPKNVLQKWFKPALGTSVKGNPMTVNGIQYGFGWGTHADSHMEFNLNGKYLRFKSLIGLDDEEMGGDGAQFKVFGDGKLLWTSPVLQHKQLDSLDLDLTGVQVLTLETDKVGTDNFDHTNWILPVIYPKKD